MKKQMEIITGTPSPSTLDDGPEGRANQEHDNAGDGLGYFFSPFQLMPVHFIRNIFYLAGIYADLVFGIAALRQRPVYGRSHFIALHLLVNFIN